MSKSVKTIYLLTLVAFVNGCTVSTTNYFRNYTNEDVVVVVKRERKDLGWEREESNRITVASNSICSISTDVFYKTFFYIQNPSNGQNVNLQTIENKNYIYDLSTDNNLQVIAFEKPSRKIKNALKSYRSKCQPIENE